MAALDWKAPDFSTVCRRQKTLQVQLPYRPSTTALDLLVDSIGIKFLGEGEWKPKKHEAEYRRQWSKVHLGIDASTLETRAIEVTENSAYDTKACQVAIAQRGAQVVIPPCKNAQPWKAKLGGVEHAQRSPASLPEVGTQHLEEVERLPSKTLGRDQDVLLQAPGREVHGPYVRASGGGTACACRVLRNRFTQLGCPTTVPVPVLA